MSIWKLLGLEPGQPAGEVTGTETVRKIARELGQLEPARAKYVAAFAYLLGRVAHADTRISEEETREMERIVTERGGLPEEQAVLAVEIAKSQNLLFGGTENYLVSKEFKKLSTREQRLALLRCLFEVSAADDGISTRESGVIRQIADEINLEHRDYVAVRSEFRDRLAVLRKDRRGAGPGTSD